MGFGDGNVQGRVTLFLLRPLNALVIQQRSIRMSQQLKWQTVVQHLKVATSKPLGFFRISFAVYHKVSQ